MYIHVVYICLWKKRAPNRSISASVWIFRVFKCSNYKQGHTKKPYPLKHLVSSFYVSGKQKTKKQRNLKNLDETWMDRFPVAMRGSGIWSWGLRAYLWRASRVIRTRHFKDHFGDISLTFHPDLGEILTRAVKGRFFIFPGRHTRFGGSDTHSHLVTFPLESRWGFLLDDDIKALKKWWTS